MNSFLRNAPPPVVPVLHILTSDSVMARSGFVALAERLLDTVGPWGALHLRIRHLSGSDYVALARRLTERARRSGAKLIVNERADVAIAAGADGVQLGRGALGEDDVRQIAPRLLRGVSLHIDSVPSVDPYTDWIILGQLFESSSHPGVPGSGAESIRRIAQSIQTPIIAVGGVTPERVGQLLDAGAHGVAVISGVWDTKEPEGEAIHYLSRYGDWAGRGRDFPHG